MAQWSRMNELSIEMIPDSTVMMECPTTVRRQAFVDAAREAFFAKGYAGTTMSSIAGKVGGSKTTLWSYFPSKEELFAAVVDDIVEHYAQALVVDLPSEGDIRIALLQFAHALMETILSEPIIALHRLVAGEATRFPHLAEMFYERGPRRGKARLAAYVEHAMERGQLRRGDPLLAVKQFSGLCQCGIYQSAMLNLQPNWSQSQLDKEVDAAVDTFYRAWRPEE